MSTSGNVATASSSRKARRQLQEARGVDGHLGRVDVVVLVGEGRHQLVLGPRLREQPPDRRSGALEHLRPRVP
jgi:hypothetical protein